jgi:uncharacterized protein
MGNYRHKVVVDPVHGAIGLSEVETKVVNTPTFQRLRRLKQLGLASLVYPTADHSRFAHSLGVFHIMGRAIDTLIAKGRLLEEDRQKLRLAALLHDVGHYPYSHLTERIDADPQRSVWLGATASEAPPVPYPDHETLGQLFVTVRPDVVSALDEAGFDPAEIATIFQGEHSNPLYNGLIHSSLDLDRMDYLVRDSLATGVPFGRIDLEYLLTHLDAGEDGRLGLLEKAATAAEHFMLARYFMTKVVYFHKTVFAFEALLRQILFLLRKEGLLWVDGNAVRRVVSEEAEFAAFCDDHVEALIDKGADREDRVGLLCKALRLRRPPVLLKEVRTVSRERSQSPEFTNFLARRKDKLGDLAERHGVAREQFLWEDPKDQSFEKLGPYLPLGRSLDPSETDEFLRIIHADRTSDLLISNDCHLVHHLSSLRFKTARLYLVNTDPPLPPEKVKAIKREVDGWLR